jgi:hypothetical protein
MNIPAYKIRTGPLRAGLILAGILLLTACGITAPRSNEGFADLDSLGVTDTDRTMALSIGPTLIRVARWALDEDDDETARILEGVDGVRIRIYEIDGDADRVALRIQNMSEKLERDAWQPVMLVQDEGEQTHMLMRSENGEIQGLTLLTSDGDSEAVVINIMGNLQPEHFGDAMVALDVDAPEVEVAPLN